MAESPTSWGAVPVAESPSSWGAVPVDAVKQDQSEGERLLAKAEKAKAEGKDLLNADSVSTYFNPMNLVRGLQVLFTKNKPLDVYKRSVEQALEVPKGTPQIPQIEPAEGIDKLDKLGATKIGAVAANTATGLVNAIPAPATPQFLLNPLADLYAAPYFLMKAKENVDVAKEELKKPVSDPGVLAENFIQAPLNVFGGSFGAGRGIRAGMGLADLRPKVPEDNITSQLSKVTTKDNLAQANAGANDIATKPLDLSSLTPDPTGKSAQESAAVMGASPTKSAVESAAAILEAEKAPKAPTELPPTLGNLIGQEVEYAGYKGQLIRTDDGAFAVLQNVTEKGKPSIVEIANTGKDPLTMAEDVGVTPNRPKAKETAKEAIPATTPAAEVLKPEEAGLPPDAQNIVGIARRLGLDVDVNDLGKLDETAATPKEPVVGAQEGATASFGNSQFKKTGNSWYYENGAKVDSPQLASMLDEFVNPQPKPQLHPLHGEVKAAFEAGDFKRVAELANQITESQKAPPSGAVGGPVVPPPPAKPAGGVPAPLNNPNPAYTYTQGISKWLPGAVIKRVIGTTSANIEAANPRVFGVLRQMEDDLNKARTVWHEPNLELSKLTREGLSKEDFAKLDLAIQNGDFETARGIMTPEMNAAFDKALKVNEEMRASSVESGRDVGTVQNHWPRRLIDYQKFRDEALSLPEASALDKALKAAEREKGAALTTAEKENLVNTMVNAQLRGSPGFLKPRTIAEIQENWLKYYEPFDVAMDSRINQVSRDVVNRQYVGKFDVTPDSVYLGEGGNFGKAIAEEKAAGRLNAKAENIIIDNLNSRLRATADFEDALVRLSNKTRAAQTALFLGDATTAIAQFGDIITSIWKYGPLDTAKGYLNKKIKLEDLDIHEGNPETTMFSRSPSNTALKRLVNKNLELTIGWADKFNKEGPMNAARYHYNDAALNPKSPEFIEMNRKYSERFPERWPEILKDLQSKEFREGKLNDNTRFFLFNELADLQPIVPSERAQLAAQHPALAAMYSLKSYWVKQLNIMRMEGYEKMKNPATRLQGVANLATFAILVGGAQALTFDYLKDLVLGRSADPSDYALSGILRLVGISRYNLYKMKQGSYGDAAASFFLPITAPTKDFFHDLGLGIHAIKGDGSPGTKSLKDFAQHSELSQYIPFVGRQYYNRVGPGYAKEQEKKQKALSGAAQPNTLSTITDMINPPPRTK